MITLLDSFKMIKHIMRKLLLAFTILAYNYSSAQTKVTAEQALKDLSTNKSIQLLDVRTQQEFDDKHLKDAINIDWKDQSTFTSTAASLDKSKPLYIYCLSGGRSAAAAKKLTALGYDVFDIEGGIIQWEANKSPIISATEKTKVKGMSMEEYNAIIQSADIVLIDFHAPWCPPCRKLAPIIDNISKKYDGKVKVIKIDVDQNDQLTKELGIKSIPMLYVFKKGKQTWSYNNFISQKKIEKQLK